MAGKSCMGKIERLQNLMKAKTASVNPLPYWIRQVKEVCEDYGERFGLGCEVRVILCIRGEKIEDYAVNVKGKRIDRTPIGV